MKNEIIPVNSVMMSDKPKFEITIDYDNADSELSAFFNNISACDLSFTKDKNLTSGLKITINNKRRNEELKMNFKDAFKREKFDVSKTDAESLGKKLTQFIKNRKAKYYMQRGFNMGDIADAYVAGCNNMWDLMMSKIADSVKAYKSDIGNETLTVNQAAEIFEFLMNNRKTPASVADVKNAYKNFADANEKMLDKIADDRASEIVSGLDSLYREDKKDVNNAPVIYTADDLGKSLNRYFPGVKYTKEKNEALTLDEIVEVCVKAAFIYAQRISENSHRDMGFKFNEVLGETVFEKVVE